MSNRRDSLAAWSITLSLAGCVQTPATGARTPPSASASTPPSFVVDGKPLCFVGANSYYPIYKPKPLVDDLFDSARALGLKVMRVWGMLDRGSLDGSVPNADGAGHKDGVYFQYWDPEQQRPAYNDGEDGLMRLDYVLDAAAKRDLKLIVVLLNNWRAFGGIDQYLMWYGLDKHHEFFTSAEPRQAYKDWLAHVITRKNRVNGRSYRDDPSIFAWELANEPRCKGGSSFDADSGWDRSTLTTWASEMSAYVKSLDPNHLVSVGDEGFLNGGGEHFAYQAADGVDHAALTALSTVDFGTFHLYPEDWRTPAGFGERWISDHLKLGRELGKPMILEEYGIKVTRSLGDQGEVIEGLQRRRDAYRGWNDALLAQGGSASLAWMLAGRGDAEARYPDYDHFAFYRDDATGQLLGGYAKAFAHAPACRAQAAQLTPASPFVSAPRPQQPVALGWLSSRTL